MWRLTASRAAFLAGITQAAFLAEIDAAAADDAAIADLEADLKMKREVRGRQNTSRSGDKRSKVGLGVAGSAAYGNDSPLYGAMGFVRKSDRASGLTRKKNLSS